MRPARTPGPAAAALLAALAVSLAGSPPAAADLVELKDGTKLDGKVIQEKDGFVWVRTLVETRKVAAADVASRTPGESPVDVLAALRAQVEKDPKDPAALWDLYLFLIEHKDEVKDFAREAKPLPAKVVKLAPDHEGARDALGEVSYEGKWVKKEDVARLEAEASRKRKQEQFQKRYGVIVDVYEGEHWVLVDNTGCKDLPKKSKDMDECYRLTAEILGADRFWDGQAEAVALKRYADYVRILDESWKAWQVPEWKYTACKDPQLGGIWIQYPTQLQMRCIPDMKTDAEDGMWAAFVHNTVHVCIWSQKRAGSPPAWFEEGLASVLEQEVRGVQKAYCVGISSTDKSGTSDRKGGKGKGNAGLAGEQQVFKEHCKKAVDDGTFPEMRKFLRMKLGDLGPAEVGGSIGLITWLRAKDAEKFKALWAELRAGPKNDDDPWRKVYGWNLIEDMEKEWKTWVRAEW